MTKTTRYFFTDKERQMMSEAVGNFKVGDLVLVTKGQDATNPRWQGSCKVVAIRECSEYPIMIQNADRELRGFSRKEIQIASVEILDQEKVVSVK